MFASGVCSGPEHFGVRDLGFHVEGFCATQTVEGKLEAMNCFGQVCGYPADPNPNTPRIQIVPTLGSKVYKWYLLWAICLPSSNDSDPPNFQDANADTYSEPQKVGTWI